MGNRQRNQEYDVLNSYENTKAQNNQTNLEKEQRGFTFTNFKT